MDTFDKQWCKNVISDQECTNLARLVHIAVILGHDVFSQFIGALLSEVIWNGQLAPSNIYGNEMEKRKADTILLKELEFGFEAQFFVFV